MLLRPGASLCFSRLRENLRAVVPFHMLKDCSERAANIPEAHFMSELLPAEAALITPAAVFVPTQVPEARPAPM